MNMLREIVSQVRHSWRELLITDIVFKLLAFAILTPLLSLSQKLTLWLTSDGLISDADFVYLFLEPIGLVCCVLVTSVWLAIIALEQASLLAILAAKENGSSLRPTSAISRAIAMSPKVLVLTAILVITSLLIIAPFGGAAFGVYRMLLGEYDINFYLSQKPNEFYIALSIGAILGSCAIAGLLWFHSAWLLSLPITIFERQTAWGALTLSRKTLSGKRWRVLRWLGLWFVVVFLANAMLASLGGLAARILIPAEIGSLVTAATRVGTLLLVLGGLSLLINLFATILFGSFMYYGYRLLRPELGAPAEESLQASSSSPNLPKVTRTRIVVALSLSLMFAAWLGVRAFRGLPLEDRAKVMAHRGASAEAPENTLAAFQLAIEQGADWIELDVQESADDQVIVMHDSDLMKQAGNPLKVWDANQEQLAAIDIGSWFSEQFADQRVPTLSEVLEQCRGKVGVNIELKYYGHDKKLEQRVVQIVESAGMNDQVMIMSLKKDGIQKARSLRPEWKCGLLLSVYAGDLKKLDVDFLAINSTFASRSFVRRAQEAGKEVYVWTVNDAATMSQMLNRGVDGLLTDRPDLARRVLQERANMSTPERILSELTVWLVGTGTSGIADP